jgi:hypothetical protein
VDLAESSTEPEVTADPFLESPTPSVDVTATVAPIATVSPTATATPTVAPTAAPTATVAPTATPTPTTAVTTAPVGQSLGSGTFYSDTGLPINVRAEWTATVLDESRVQVTVKVVLESYALQINESYKAVNVSVGDQYASANAPAVDYDGSAKLETVLGTTTHTLSLSGGQSQTFPVAVEYQFGGTYSGEDLPVIECGGNITLSR